MKRTYIKPQIKVIKIDTESILAGSTRTVSGTVDGSANAPSYIDNSLWDDEESDF